MEQQTFGLGYDDENNIISFYNSTFYERDGQKITIPILKDEATIKITNIANDIMASIKEICKKHNVLLLHEYGDVIISFCLKSVAGVPFSIDTVEVPDEFLSAEYLSYVKQIIGD